MSIVYLSRDEVRELDRRATEEFGIPAIVLMENAGRGTAELLLNLGVHGPVVICCGKGNNGGDGFVMARHLHNHSIAVHVMLFGWPEELTSASVNCQTIMKMGLHITRHLRFNKNKDVDAFCQELQSADWVVDALFGTGLTGPVRAPLDQVIAAMNEGPGKVLAVDIPSGLDADTGLPLGPTVRAHHTATMAALKRGFANPEAAQWLGQVHVIDIGAPRELLEL